ncbi:MAG TPA: ABC transporter permease, partial [Thermoleophilaceae bacterium]
MSKLPSWRRYLRFWGPDLDADIDEELRFHLEQLTAAYEANGLSHQEAVRAARVRFGDTAAIGSSMRQYDKESVRRQARAERVRLLGQQLLVALRGLRRAPSFTIAVVLTLALGIGLSTAVFDVASTLLLRPLPVRDEGRLVLLSGRTRDGTIANYPLPLDEAREFARASSVLAGTALVSYYGAVPQPVVRDDRIVPLKVAQVSGNFFALLGMRPTIGRLLRDEDDVVGAGPVAVLSHDAWMRNYGGDSAVLGTLLRVHSTGIAYVIVGVATEGLGYPGQTDVWVPIATSTPHGAERFVMVNLLGRLRAGRSAEQAREELATYYTRPGAPTSEADLSAAATGLRTVVLGDVRPAVIVFAVAAALLLAIACINVGTLMLVRVLSRAPELAVRSALGARRWHLAGLLMTEGALLAGVGGSAGVALAVLVLKAFRTLAPATLPRLSEVRSSAQTLGVAIVVTAFALLAFAVVPAYRHSRVDAGEVL